MIPANAFSRRAKPAWFRLEPTRALALERIGTVVHGEPKEVAKQCPTGALEVRCNVKWKSAKKHHMLRQLLTEALL